MRDGAACEHARTHARMPGRMLGGAGCCADLEEAGGGLISHAIC